MHRIFLLVVMIFWFSHVTAADSLYGAFSAQSPPGPVGRGTIWNISVNAAALTADPASLDLAIPGGPLRNYVRRTSTVISANTISWIGTNGVDEAIFHAEQGIVSGIIFAGTEHYEIEPLDAGSRFEWVDQSKAGEPSLRLPTQIQKQIVGTTHPRHKIRQETRAAVASVDVLYVYTPQALAGVGSGGINALRSQIFSAVAATNNAYLQSNANITIRTAGIEAVPGGIIDSCIPPDPICQSENYGEAISRDLNSVRLNSSVSARRNALSADIVVLIIENGGGAAPPNQTILLCGAANVMRETQLSNFAPFAYSVVRRSCATGNLTLAHELGHNMGLEHHPFEITVQPEPPTFPWSFGHSKGGTTSGFHTIMSTNYECLSKSLLCSLIPRFSNPSLTSEVNNGGVITQEAVGEDFRDNARTLRRTGQIAANWRGFELFVDGFEKA